MGLSRLIIMGKVFDHRACQIAPIPAGLAKNRRSPRACRLRYRHRQRQSYPARLGSFTHRDQGSLQIIAGRWARETSQLLMSTLWFGGKRRF